MRLLSVTLGTVDLPALRRFYVEAMELAAIEDTPDALALRVGWTTLRFERADRAPATAHFAFNIPPDSMDRAMEWLGARAPLLSEEGVTRFEFASWNAQAIYALDPAGNVIELIARRRLSDRLGDAAFGAESLLCVSEIGIVTGDPPDAGRALCEAFELSIFSAADADFTTVGDDEGLLIIVPPGRAWKPTADVMSIPTPTRITLEGGEGSAAGEWAATPYIVRSMPRAGRGRRSL